MAVPSESQMAALIAVRTMRLESLDETGTGDPLPESTRQGEVA